MRLDVQLAAPPVAEPVPHRHCGARLSVRLYYICHVLDVIGAGIRDFAFTLVILATVQGPTLGLVGQQAVLALVYICGIALVRGLKVERHWRAVAFVANVTMTFMSVVAAVLAAHDLLTYKMLLAYAVVAGACSALGSSPAVRLRRYLGGGAQQRLAWALDANGYIGKLVSGLICLGMIVVLDTVAKDQLRITATLFLIVDALLSVPVGCFYYRLFRAGGSEPVGSMHCHHGPSRVGLWKAFIATLTIHKLRLVFLAEAIKGLLLSVPFAWQILRQDYRANDQVLATLAVGLAVAGLCGNLLGATMFRWLACSRRVLFRVLVILMPLSLLAAAYAPNQWWFVGWMMVFTALASPVDSVTDATLVEVPIELAARIAEIRGLFNRTVAAFGRMGISWLVLVSLSLTPQAALAALASAAVLFFLALGGSDLARSLRRKRRAMIRAQTVILGVSPAPEVLTG